MKCPTTQSTIEPATPETIAAVEESLQYTFRNQTLLSQALTLPSWHDTTTVNTNNQRLEFLGDAVLGLLAAEQLYTTLPDADEGTMSLLRTRVASKRSLAEVARMAAVHQYMRMGASEEEQGGRQRESAQADLLEALFGAVWLDGGLEAARALYQHLMADRVSAANATDAARYDNPKGELQERTQANDGSVPIYEVVAVHGPPHEPLYEIKVTLNSGITATATGCNKRAAETAAAKLALALLRHRETKAEKQ